VGVLQVYSKSTDGPDMKVVLLGVDMVAGDGPSGQRRESR
jgi:hypothetical protein